MVLLHHLFYFSISISAIASSKTLVLKPDSALDVIPHQTGVAINLARTPVTRLAAPTITQIIATILMSTSTKNILDTD